MNNNKLLSLLATFSAREIRAFQLFVRSPYFNQDERLTALLSLLTSSSIEESTAQEFKQQLHQQLFPQQAFEDKRIRYLFSDLSRLAEQFLLQEHYRGNSLQQQLDFAQICNQRKLPKLYRRTIQKIAQHFDQQPQRDVRYFQQHLEFAMIKDEHFQQQRLRKFDENLQWVADDLDRYYYLQKLRQACVMLDRQAILTANYDLGISQEWLNHLVEKSFFDEPIIRIYYTILMSSLEENELRHFEELKQILTTVNERVTNTDLAHIYRFAINYCARKIRKGRSEYLEEALQLYLKGIASELFLEDGHLSPWTFTNVVKLALRLEKFEWIAEFIPQYAPSLPEEFQENALHYNYAELYYYSKDLDRALTHLNQVALDDLNYALGARVMLAKIYFETTEENALLSLLAAFSLFLKRNRKISANIKHTYLNFCDLLFQLIRRNPKKLEKIRKKIEETNLLTDRGWLLSVCEQMEAQLIKK
ncbi:MAG: hypothetical protein HRU41_17765 [Saprospiraceae bacterium]|nr:hypothetical protein [Saprospiraceae bacterium]